MDIQTYQRQLRGAQSRKNGELFEDMVTASCHHYFALRKALIIKTPEPMKPIKSLGSGRFVAVYDKKAQPDYKGTLVGGQSVLFEAKHTDTDRLKYSAVTTAQATSFDFHTEMGTICFVLISFGFRKFYKVPWQVFKRMKEIYGRKYIKPEDLGRYEIQYINGVIKFLEQEDKAK